MDILENYFNYLIEKGYKKFTPKGNKSTSFDYVNRIKRICKDEGISAEQLANKINDFVVIYDVGGKKEAQGKKSKSAYINALKRFNEFVSKINI